MFQPLLLYAENHLFQPSSAFGFYAVQAIEFHKPITTSCRVSCAGEFQGFRTFLNVTISNTVTILSSPDVIVVVIPADRLLVCSNLNNCLREFMDSSSVYPYFTYAAYLYALNLIVVFFKVVELLNFVFLRMSEIKSFCPKKKKKLRICIINFYYFTFTKY